MLNNVNIEDCWLWCRFTCISCEGTKIEMHPAWVSYYGSIPIDDETVKDREQARQWFLERGVEILPPESIPCSFCGGRGFLERWIDIETIAEILRVRLSGVLNQKTEGKKK